MRLLDSRREPTEADRRVMGEDCGIHGFLGIAIGHGNGTPGEQARNFLKFCFDATIFQAAWRFGTGSAMSETGGMGDVKYRGNSDYVAKVNELHGTYTDEEVDRQALAWAEYLDLLRRLAGWQKTNTVKMPPALTGHIVTGETERQKEARLVASETPEETQRRRSGLPMIEQAAEVSAEHFAEQKRREAVAAVAAAVAAREGKQPTT
jgi:hypothetical protein